MNIELTAGTAVGQYKLKSTDNQREHRKEKGHN